VSVGLADSIGTFESALADLGSKSKARAPTPRQRDASGLSLNVEERVPPAGAVRPAADRAMILEAGRKAGLEEVATTLADHSPAKVPTEAALELMRMQLTQKIENERHSSGLYLDPSLSVRNGPLFSGPDTSAGPEGSPYDHGWGDVVANVNKKH
jgi:hypothetical protein